MKFIVLFVALYLLIGLVIFLKFCDKELREQVKNATNVVQIIFYICALFAGPVIYAQTLLKQIINLFRNGGRKK